MSEIHKQTELKMLTGIMEKVNLTPEQEDKNVEQFNKKIIKKLQDFASKGDGQKESVIEAFQDIYSNLPNEQEKEMCKEVYKEVFGEKLIANNGIGAKDDYPGTKVA